MSTNNYARDIAAFLANYPGVPKSEPKKDPCANYLFYLNQLPCQPDNLLLEDIFSKSVAPGSRLNLDSDE